MSIAECPRCGYHLATEFKEGVSALEAEVRCLDDLISRLQEEKAILSCRMNNAQEETRHLPFEVLSNIFQFARPPMDFTAFEPKSSYVEDLDYPPLTRYYDPAEYFHLILAAVSHRWRQVALSTPQLWTSISLRVLNAFTNFNTSLLDLHFQNAHNLLVSIRLDMSNCALMWSADAGLKRYDSLEALEPLEKTIFDRKANKIHSLILIEPPIEWFTSSCGNLSRCNSVTMYWPNPGHSDFHFDFEDLPCLQHVKLVDSSIQFALPTTVTALQLSETDLTHCLGLLAELPNLVKLETTEASTGAIEPVILDRLKHLTWNKMRVDENHDFLSCVRFVNLTTLEWGERRNLHGPLSEEGRRLRLAFFASLPSTLSSLTFGYIELDYSSLVNLLDSVPQLAKLQFSGSPWQVVVDAVETIGRPLINRGVLSSPSNILPNLCALSVSGNGLEAEAFIFIEMLETLHNAGPRPKRFILTTNSDVDWHADALHKVRALLSSGMDVKIIFARGESTFSVPSD